MGEFSVGQKYRTMEDQENRFVIDAIRDLNIRIGIYSQSPSLIYFGWDLIWSPITRECRRRCLNWMEAMRAALISQYHDESTATLSTAVKAFRKKEGGGMLIDEISAESKMIVAAGTFLLHPLLLTFLYTLS